MYEMDDYNDELNEAADLYPLNTNIDDWDTLHAMIGNIGTVAPLSAKDRKLPRGSGRSLLMVFVVFAIFAWKEVADTEINTVFKNAPVQTQQNKFLISSHKKSENTAAVIRTKQHNPLIKEHKSRSIDHHTTSCFFDSRTIAPEATDIANTVEFYQLKRADTSAKTPTIISLNKRNFYFGLGGGFDASTISNQAIRKTGANVGLIAGKYLTNSLALEAGVFFGKRYYYTSGKYFSMNKVGPNMPQGMQIMEVNGMFNTLHFPLKLKYDLLQTQNNNLFITGGIQATLIMQERNNYMVMYNNQMSHDKGIYRKNNFTPLSDAVISIGFERKVTSKIKLRVEPYHSIPLKSSGMGEINVRHTGANILLMYSPESR